MGILITAIGVWIVALVGWVLVSKYFKSADVDKIKQRLTGPSKVKSKGKAGKEGPQSVINSGQTTGNQFAQLLVEKYRLGPKMQILLEQAGLKWTPARLVHFCIVAFMAGFFGGWMLLPIPMLL